MSVADSLQVFSRHESKKMAVARAAVPLVFCLQLTLLYWARTFVLTHFCSKVWLGARGFWLWEGCLLPSSLLCMVSTPAVCSALAIRAFVFPGWKISACCSRYISVPEALKKQRTHSHAEASSLEKWGNQQNSASVRPPSRIISPCAHCVLHDAPECL